MQQTIARDQSPQFQSRRPRQRWGIFVRKERWGLSWRGWLVLFLTGVSATVFLLFNVEPFLAETHRVDTDTLVVEGWVHDHAIRAAVEELKAAGYQRVFTTGGPVVGLGHYVNDYQTSASVGADLLKKFGVSPELVQMVPSRVMDRDRTFGSAVALRDWLEQHNVNVRSFNILTEDTHARRTRLLFKKAMGKDVTIGTIAVPNPDYDKGRWWWYSEGVKDVGSEALAYLYASLFFHPSGPVPAEKAARVSQVHR
jgi:uncharacterized SAM-binding protein YcdF (DUF218 family)